jgi:hypothetical protein
MGDNYHFHLKNACNEKIALAPFAALLGHYGQNLLLLSKNCLVYLTARAFFGFPTVWKPFICIILEFIDLLIIVVQGDSFDF